MSTIQAAMAQLLPAERQAREGRALLSLNASISRTLLTIEQECQPARQLRKIQTEIRRHILATLVDEETADSNQNTAQGPSEREASREDFLPHPDTVLPSIEQELYYAPVTIASSTVGGTPGEAPERKRRPATAILNESDDLNDQSPTAKKRAADDEFDSVAKRPKTWLGTMTRGFFA
ncbi:uncharacterized protein BKA55DRAFT_689393 [Fusarium redolens]|uniref:Uncharacterized protein n=1 Tax=Fusarium redolens TaxID=48865 RepID=A0A9P9HAC3_FUSRE|nr:uncharacterized protein BKA55DRAFT_689393 [Fusarium redolens]KAH7253891.1 hypothetical protein BKA55DRAFT_689393 [Fusarium redolens]